MDFRYFIDWRPVSTLPVQNSVWKTDALTSRSVKEPNQPEVLKKLFERHKELIMFDYAMRLDGIFVFRIGTNGPMGKEDFMDLLNELSDIIKCITGHKHDFHSYPYTKKCSDTVLKKVSSWCKRKCQLIVYKLLLFDFDPRNQLNKDLHIHPVEIENPFTEAFQADTRKKFISLKEVIEPVSGDIHLAQLRVRDNKQGQRACLRLRALFAGKKEICLAAYQRRDRLIKSWISSKINGIILASIIFLLLHYFYDLGWINSLSVAFVTGIGTYIYTENRLQAPKLEVIQRAIGFYAYANIYSSIIEVMYRETDDGPSFNTNTGNFTDISNILKARLDLEKEAIANRKYLWTIGFALIATTVGLSKLSVDLTKIKENVNFVSPKSSPQMENTNQIIGVGANKAEAGSDANGEATDETPI